MIKACISQVKELVLESLEEGDVGGVAGDMEREGFSHEEVFISCKLKRNYLVLGINQLLSCGLHQRLHLKLLNPVVL